MQKDINNKKISTIKSIYVCLDQYIYLKITQSKQKNGKELKIKRQI